MPPKRRISKSAEPPADDSRLLDRRRANREAANRCRQRRKEDYNKMKQDYLDFDCKNVEIRQEIRDLARMKAQLEEILRSHQCVLQNVANNGGSTVDRDAAPSHCCPAGNLHTAPAALGAPPSTGQTQGTVAAVPVQQDSSSTIQTPGQGQAAGQGQGQTQVMMSTVTVPSDPGVINILPASFQSQLLDRFTVGGAFGMDQDAEHAQYNSEASASGVVGDDDDNEDCLDERYEESFSLSRVGVENEHSYCQGSDNSTS